MKAEFRILVDACVLANFSVCDLLLRLAEAPRQHLLLWSADILDEVARVHSGPLQWPAPLVASFQAEVRRAFPEAMVDGYGDLVAAMTNDPGDRHVLAAAVRGGADAVVTFNVRDFPPEACEGYGLLVLHPDAYLLTLYEMEPAPVVQRVTEIAARRGRALQDLLLRLGKTLPRFSARLLLDLQFA